MHAVRDTVVATRETAVDTAQADTLLCDVIDVSSTPVLRIEGVVLLPLVALDGDACGVVDGALIGLPVPIAAPVVGATLVPTDIGRVAAVSFVGGDTRSPVILGLLARDARGGALTGDALPERVVIAARQAIELRCGDASLTLTQSGRVIVRGEHIASESAGVHAIRGATVQIN
jgi:hypothetical protein